MQTISIAICEDSESDASKLRRLIELSSISADVHTYESTTVFLESFRPGFFQLVFLDIYFGSLDTDGSADGVEAAKKIREADADVWIVFTTSSPDYAIFGYKVRADRYITKPLDEQEVLSLLGRAATHFSRLSDELVVTVNRKDRSIRLRDIRYVEAHNKQCVIYLQDETVATYTTIDELEKLLRLPSFLRCHRSYIVNMAHIETAGRDFVMRGGGVVYISHSNQWKIRKAYLGYVARRRVL
jgi:DNA-binding LytR/AlgR family response regulator